MDGSVVLCAAVRDCVLAWPLYASLVYLSFPGGQAKCATRADVLACAFSFAGIATDDVFFPGRFPAL